jgi:pimeloyl-ACP methyl ester carboxylesterase
MRMVWLPGAFHTPEDFIDAGFEDAVRERDVALDLEFVHLELEHVGDRGTVARLAREIIAPARAHGCRTIWLGGISLGGFFALDYAATQAGEWDGLCLLAPYLGNRMLITEISSARDVAAWEPGPLAESDEERRIWRFVQARPAEARPVETRTVETRTCATRPLYLGYGRDDRFALAHGLLAQTLSPDAVRVVPGGHDWQTWLTLWGQFLDSRFA